MAETLAKVETGSSFNHINGLQIPVIEYGLTAAIAIFLIRWVIISLTKELETIKNLLGKQVDQTRELHSCVGQLKREFNELRNEARDFFKDMQGKGWKR